MKKELAAGAVIFFVDRSSREYLLLKNIRGEWGFAKGKTEEGESTIETALREIKEETGLDVDFVAEQFEHTYSYTFINDEEQEIDKTVALFIAQSDSKDVALSGEHTDYQWLAHSQARAALTHESDKQSLDKVEKLLS